MERTETKIGLLGKIGRAIAGKWPYFLVVLFGMIITMGIWVFWDQVLTGDDYAFQVMRMQSASRAWANGQIIPQVDPGMLSGFGYGYNLFYGPLITYVVAAVQAVVDFWPLALNVTLVLCVLGMGLSMCHAMLKISRNRALSLMVAVIYMAAPYLLNDLYSRMALGEVMAAVAAPILLLGLYQLTAHQGHASRNIAISAALLILSHSLSAVLFALMGVLYVLLNLRRVFDWESIWRMILGGIVAVGLTACFTLPLIEAKMTGIYGVFDEKYSEVYFGANAESMNDHRLWPQQLLAMGDDAMADSSRRYDVMLGVMLLIGLFGFWFVCKTIENKDERRFVRSLYIIGVISILATLALVDWRFAPQVLLNMQFSWRLLIVTTVVMSVVSGYTIFALVRQLAREQQAVVAVMVSILAIYVVMPRILPNPEQHIANIEMIKDELASVGWQAEYVPMQLLCSAEEEEDVKQGYGCSLTRLRERLVDRGKEIEVLDGEVRFNTMQKDGLNLEFFIENTGEADAVLELPLIYYPGYQAALDGEGVTVSHSDENGLVTVLLPGGASGEVKVWYGMSYATRIGALVSIVTVGLGLVWIVISGIKSVRHHQKDDEMEKLMDSVREVVEDADDQSIDLGEPIEPPVGLPVMPVITAEEKAEKADKPKKVTKRKTSAKTSKTEAAVEPKVTKVKSSSRTKKEPE